MTTENMRVFNFILPVVTILTILKGVDADTNVVALTSQKPTNRVHAHHMHRASHTPDGATQVTKGPQTTSVTVVKRADMPSLSESETKSYSYSLAIPNAIKTSSSRKDPYIYRSNLPENLVFIVVGAIIGFILLSFLGYRITAYILSNQRAKTDREVYTNFGHNSGSGFAFGSESSNSSMLEKSSLGSVSSLHMLSRHNSLLQLQHDTDTSTLSNSQQGRSYRNAISDNKSNRGSMFISPVLELMNTKSNSQLELPLYHKNASQTFNSSLASLIQNPVMMDSPINDFQPTRDHTNGSSPDMLLVQTQLHPQQPQSKLKRPPSMVLDNLIN